MAGRVGRYVLLDRVGRGGMGEVHRARAFGAAGVTKELCIKRIRCERLADPSSLARFVSEARLSMRLSHANIVSVFDFGRSQGDYYLAMEWVEGCDLRRLLAEREGEALDEDVALFVATEIARALAYLHALEGEGHIAHCDLKPANVLLSRAGEVKLADFGVAAHEAGAAVGGTRRYMAPEQRRSGVVAPAVDLYALGLLLDEMLGGQAARRAPEDDAPPGVAWPAYEAPAVSPALASLLERLCALDPAERPASAREVGDALEALLAEARVRLGRSPRELLAQRVSESARPRETTRTGDEEELRTDASYLTEGESETFARRMKPGSSPRSESRATPIPPRPAVPSRARGAAIGGLALALALALGLGLGRRAAPDADAEATPHGAEPRTVAAPTPTSALATREVAEPTAAVAVGTADEGDDGVETSAAPPLERRRPPAHEPALEEPVPPPPSQALESAHVRVNARPWAEVRIDGSVVGVTPIVDFALAPGEHDLELVNPALGRSHTAHLSLAPGEARDVIVDLRSAP